MRDRTEDKITLMLIRHAAADSNLQRRYLGRTDEPLCEKGRKELLSLKDGLKAFGPQLIFSSPMKRCLQTAKIVFGEAPVIIDEWTETDFGRFELKSYEELKDDPDYRQWIESRGELRVCGTESRSELVKRSLKGLRKAVNISSEKGALKAAAVVHGGTIMALLSSLTKEDYYSFQSKCGQGYIVEIETRPDIRLSNYKRIG